VKIVVVVSDFPKVTETFVAANVLHYLSQGHDAQVFHLKPFRQDEVVHDHTRPVVERGFTFPWIGGASAVALAWGLLRRPGAVLGAVTAIFRAFWAEPRPLLASLAILPKALALGRLARAQGVDHIHAEFAGYPATAAWIAARVSGVPFSFSAHMHDIFVTQGLLVDKARAARFVRVISDYNRRFLAALPGFPAEKLHVLRCGVTLSAPAPLPPAPGRGQALRILYVGSLIPRKGVAHLLRAVAALPDRIDWRLDILGGGPEDDRLRVLATRLGLGERVRFRGPQAAPAVRAAMQAAHVVVVPSVTDADGQSEGIPVVLMEALAEARPVIASNLSGIPELVRDGETGWLAAPGDADAIAAALMRVHDDYDAAATLGQAGRALVVRDYDIDCNAAALLAMVEAAT